MRSDDREFLFGLSENLSVIFAAFHVECGTSGGNDPLWKRLRDAYPAFARARCGPSAPTYSIVSVPCLTSVEDDLFVVEEKFGSYRAGESIPLSRFPLNFYFERQNHPR